MTDKLILGIDIGGTGIKAAPTDIGTGKLVLPSEYRLTPAPFGVDDVASVVGDLIEHFSWEGSVGVGYPGVVHQDKALSAAHLSDDWLGLNLVDLFKAKARGAVSVINDADAAGLAEMRFGAGKTFNSPGSGTVLMFTLGTGIGSALFHGGRLLPNTEFGHISIEGTEAELMAAGSIRTKENLEWQEWAKRLNRYLAEMEMLLTPELIIIGGGVSENFAKFKPFLKTRADVVPAKMGNDAGIIGAALAAAEK